MGPAGLPEQSHSHMTNTPTNTQSINTTNSGFESYLDFRQLRTSSIEYLSQLTGKIWTDYNAHDPGITILEMLCYAVLDLGYRNNFPVADILARAPGDTTKDDNFFTPGQILACNPLTILDYRKLLIDLDGIRNAWIEVDMNETNICRKGQTPGGGTTPFPTVPPAPSLTVPPTPCLDFLNGLYNIYIELEDGAEPNQDQIVSQVK